ncbi:MAG: NlpC/P60 family protein [Miniphocaeibacter sp.]|uniref:C40 family peptidase n=1 Tax=Miniphocaeibacter sp. TaxID=3100973 RepID=UPI00182F0F28|nr:SH3 domain-containing protein [Gallicola sp.]
MNKKKLGASLGFVSLIALGVVGLSNETLSDVLKSAPKNYVESISDYKEEDINKIIDNNKNNKKENIETIKLALDNTIYEVSKKDNSANVQEEQTSQISNASNENNSTVVQNPVETKAIEESNISLSGEKTVDTSKTTNSENANSNVDNNSNIESNVNSEVETVVVNENESSLSDENTTVSTPKIETNEAKVIELPVEGWISHNLNVRSSAKIDAENIIGTLTVGSKISGTESNGWVKIEFEGKEGYVSRDYISNTEIKAPEKEETPAPETPENSPNTEEEQNDTGNTLTGWVKSPLNLRENNNTSSKVLTVIPAGTKVTGTESNGWVKISYNGLTGYIAKSYISDTEIKNEENNKETNTDETVETDSSTINKIVNSAYGYVGSRYVYGSADPSTGFDCSGLTYYLYKTHAGITLHRNSAAQASNGYQVSKSNLKPGDLLFFATSGGKNISHVGIYVGNGKMVHASTPATGVKVDDINSNYYVNNYVTARRIID